MAKEQLRKGTLDICSAELQLHPPFFKYSVKSATCIVWCQWYLESSASQIVVCSGLLGGDVFKEKKDSLPSKVSKFSSRSMKIETKTRRKALRVLGNIGNDDYSPFIGDGGLRQFYLNSKGWPAGHGSLGISQ